MTMTPHEWSIMGMYAIVLSMAGLLVLYVELNTGKASRRRRAR